MNALATKAQTMSIALNLDGFVIRQDANGRFCLNDLHRASGGEKRHGPSYWLHNSQTQDLIRELETTGIPAVETYEGASGGTYVAKELVYSCAMWISAAFNLKVIRAYDSNVMRPAELSRMDILRLAMESEEARIKAEAERDEAIRTKAYISDKKTATAMATASAKSREVARLLEEVGRSHKSATVKAVKKKIGIEYDWRHLKSYCLIHNLEARTVDDEQYGSVRSWPAEAWRDVYDVDLKTLFPKPSNSEELGAINV